MPQSKIPGSLNAAIHFYPHREVFGLRGEFLTEGVLRIEDNTGAATRLVRIDTVKARGLLGQQELTAGERIPVPAHAVFQLFLAK